MRCEETSRCHFRQRSRSRRTRATTLIRPATPACAVSDPGWPWLCWWRQMRDESAAVSKCALASVQMRSVLFVLALLVLSGLSACGGGSSPAAPSPSASAQVGGLWTGTATRTSVTGGECLGPTACRFGAKVAENHPHNSADWQLADRHGHQHSMHAAACTYSGSAGTDTISLTLQSCLGGRLNNIKCTNGDLRDMELVGDAFTGTVDAAGIVGTEEQTVEHVCERDRQPPLAPVGHQQRIWVEARPIRRLVRRPAGSADCARARQGTG